MKNTEAPKEFYIDGWKYTAEKREPRVGDRVVVTRVDGDLITPRLVEVTGVGGDAFGIEPILFEAFGLYFDAPEIDAYYVVTDAILDIAAVAGVGETQADNVEKPSHYTAGDIEVINIIAQTVAGYDEPFVAHCVGTATKYLNRAPYKHVEPTEDLRKAAKYIEFAIKHLTKGDE